jgi:hypothetical protein
MIQNDDKSRHHHFIFGVSVMLKILQFLAILGLVLVAGRLTFEGIIKLPGLRCPFTEWRRGRVAVGVATFRPGRIYYKLVIA